MNFFLINKLFLPFIVFIILSACSSKEVYKKIKLTKYEAPIIESYDDNDIVLNNINSTPINYKDKVLLKGLKNNNQYSKNVVILNDNVFILTNNNKLFNYQIKTGELIFSKEIKITSNDNDIIVSFDNINKSFLVAYKSGLIAKLDINGDVIWKFESNKVLNSPLKIINEQIIALYVDEIKGILINDGRQIWSEVYEDIPVYQAKGGQIVNFLNLLYFILPNNKVGSIDFNLGSINNSNFNNIPLISSINNTQDKIHIFENYLVYLDEGKYLYTYDIFKNDFIIFNKNIEYTTSNLFFNNSLILKDGNFIHAINIINGKTFWLIENKKISKKSELINIRSINNNIEIFLKNGDVIIVNNKDFADIKNLNVNKIKNITFDKQNIIVLTENGKTIIF